MKFNKNRTALRSSFEGLEQYDTAFVKGLLRKVNVYPSICDAVPGIWSKLRVGEFTWVGPRTGQPLEAVGMRIRTRAFLIDEVTRHRNTDQIFIPINKGVLAVAGASLYTPTNEPDPDGLNVISIEPGEAIRINAGTWHTLPFAMFGETICMSVMLFEDPDDYHDVRDISAAGWVGVLNMKDPNSIH